MTQTTQPATPAVIEKKSRFAVSQETRNMIVKNIGQTIAYVAIGLATEIAVQAAVGAATNAYHSIREDKDVEGVEEIDESIKDL